MADGRVQISIDTRHAEVARQAVAAGATIINDVSSTLDGVAADLGVGWVAMHMQGDPRTMQDEPAYDNVVAEVRDFLVDRAERATAAGVSEVWIDPGIGFGKTIGHNLALLARLDALVSTGWRWSWVSVASAFWANSPGAVTSGRATRRQSRPRLTTGVRPR